MRRLLFVGTVALACWDAWRWYAQRISATPEETVSLAAAVALIAVLAVMRGRATGVCARRTLPLVPAVFLLVAYAFSHLLTPPIVRCAIAVMAVLWCGYVAATDERPPLAFWGLAALSLPVLPSLQFTLGFPMRVASAAMTVGLLRLQGLAVERQGTLLAFDGRSVQFDAPCSGVAMLWVAVLATLMAATVHRLACVQLIAALSLALVATIAGNVLRTASLFYLETELIRGPAWWHEAIGMAAFAVSAGGSMWFAGRLATTEARNSSVEPSCAI